MIYIGFDPGKTGAIGIIDTFTGVTEVHDIPIMLKNNTTAKVKYELDGSGIARILAGYDVQKCVVGVEKVHSMRGQGVASCESIGDSRGCIRGVIQALGFRFEYITPQSWRKHHLLPARKDKNKRKEETRALAIKLFPDQPLHRKKDQDRAEALLMAKYLADKYERQRKIA